MAYVSKINGYVIKDAEAREDIADLKKDVSTLNEELAETTSTANEAWELAQGAVRSIAFKNFDQMRLELRSEDSKYNPNGEEPLKVGDILYLEELNVPDYWVSEVYGGMTGQSGEKALRVDPHSIVNYEDGEEVPDFYDLQDIEVEKVPTDNGEESLYITLANGQTAHVSNGLYRGTVSLPSGDKTIYYIKPEGDWNNLGLTEAIAVDGVELSPDGIYLVAYDYAYPSDDILGYYAISELEGRKVILTDYAKTADIENGTVIAKKATQLNTARKIELTGDATGSVSFDGSKNVQINVTITDDSHNHTISNVDGLQSALDAKLNATTASSTYLTKTDASNTYATKQEVANQNVQITVSGEEMTISHT